MSGNTKDYEKLMNEIFEGFEYRIFEKLRSVDGMLATISLDAGASGVPAQKRHEFVIAKLIDMFEQLADQREGRAG